ncbi:dephospho-CoA kinase [Rhodopirellula sp. JC740]|uniref:Dephospho-CoA kinase n=1 Tax=Rhodopirellula halodulae TaxID=2894198 RepID=A0ABS8NEM1_9BACT|nr:dephospho-CoA kinase [Rhodopirellula sp. JC740]MCC9641377.1 dephospho-CoA kinase [Rhodopirellula sp. JC740]
MTDGELPEPRPPIIGVIGPPCSGKSTVAKHLQSRGGEWINADLIAKQQLDCPDVIQELTERLGSSIVTDDGTISKKHLADLVFGDDADSFARLRVLESVVHPRTRRAIHDRIAEAARQERPFVILDIPLLIESGYQSICDEVWCMEISAEHHQRLLAERGWDDSELQRRAARQLPWKEKAAASTRVLRNEGTLADLKASVDVCLHETLNRD